MPPTPNGHATTALCAPRHPPWPALIDRCLDGDDLAWGELFELMQPKLVKIVRLVLGSRTQDQDLIEEIAARVWFSLVDRRYRSLRRFDKDRGMQLTTYLGMLARHEWLQYLRAERRRATREMYVAVRRGQEQMTGQSTETSRYQEFRLMLTNREREYWDILLGETFAPEPSLSQANVWKLRERIRKKFLAYLKGSSEPQTPVSACQE